MRIANSRLLKSAAWLLPAFLLPLLTVPAGAEEPAARPSAEAPSDPGDVQQPSPPTDPAGAKKAFDDRFAEWKDVLKQIRTLQVDYQTADEDQRKQLRVQFDDLVAQGEKMLPGLISSAKHAFNLAEEKDPNVAKFLASVMTEYLESDNYDRALSLAQSLEGAVPENLPQFNSMAAVAAYGACDFDAAAQYLKEAEAEEPFNSQSEFGKRLTHLLQSAQQYTPEYRQFWEKEQKIREAEAKADDLPRVKMKTSKGDIVIELFENEAPQSVANFITLVEKDFYDGLTFHRVLAGFMAQGGCPRGDGTGGPPYHIPCECYQDNHRKHFRGTLSMAHAGKDTGGSQFFLTFLPTPHLNGKHTAFGRVIEGMDVLSDLNRTGGDNVETDKIIEATVLRKRDHDYSFEKLPARR